MTVQHLVGLAPHGPGPYHSSLGPLLHVIPSTISNFHVYLYLSLSE